MSSMKRIVILLLVFCAAALSGCERGEAVPEETVENVALETVEAAKVLCVTVNPVSAYVWTFDAEPFRKAMQAAVDVPVINVKEATV